MSITTQNIKNELAVLGNPAKAAHLSRFFKTGKGQYGEGDLFIGVTVPEQRSIAKKYQDADVPVLEELICSPFHEERLTALFILEHQFTKHKKDEKRQECINFYVSHTNYINNWDLVDLSCYKILGRWLADKDRSLLYEWAVENHLWRQRIAMVTCMYFVRKGDFKDCMAIADLLLNHPHDLIHKAVGWLLREVGKKDKKILAGFLYSRYQHMPRTMLRYAIEHFPEEERKKYLQNNI